MDKAGRKYWQNVWKEKTINKLDLNYYTNKLLDDLFKSIFSYDNTKTICEIGCAFSAYLLYFNDEFGFQINGCDYERISAVKTAEIYKKMGYKANIFYKDFFSNSIVNRYDILFSWGVFEHFDNLNNSILKTRDYVNSNGYIVTVIPNMNGLVGFFQKIFNKKIYDVHIPYTKYELFKAHENAGYKTIFCDYFGIWQMGVVNISNIKYEDKIGKILAIPGKPLFYLSKIFKKDISSKYFSPYIIYVGKK